MLVIDGWDAPNKDYYMSIDAFYFDDEWILRRFLLSFEQLPDAKGDADALAAYVRRVLEKRKLQGYDIAAIVSDTTNVMPAMASELGVAEKWFPCMIHQGNLVLKHGINEVPEMQNLLARVADVVNWTKAKKKSRTQVATPSTNGSYPWN